MARAASAATGYLGQILKAPDGLSSSVGTISEAAGISLPSLGSSSIFDRYVSPEISEKLLGARYPAVYVFCEKATNAHTEKFRTFSGTAQLVIDVRVSHDHVDELQVNLQHYVDAVTDVLDRNRGSWGQGMYYPGGYEIHFHPVKPGGRCYLQTAKVTLQIHLSVD